jgi:sugar phosphate isomerase/epimerase
MLRGLTAAGLGDVRTPEQLIDLASRYGFDCVDWSARDLVERSGGAEQARGLLREKNVVIGAIGLPVNWRSTEEKFRAGLGRLVEEAEAACELGVTRCCTYILPSVDQSPAHFMAVATRRLRLCARILGAYGIRFGLEFVGPHHLRTAWKHAFIRTLQETLDWIEAIGEPNVGLLLDSFHWHTTGLTTADIEALSAEQIVHVHLNDAKDVPIEEVLDNDRLYPGEGVIDLAGFLRALHRIGYRGPVSQEILTRTPPAEDPETLARRSKDAYDRVFAAAGLA